MDIIVNNVGFSADEKLKSLIFDRLNKLTRYYNRIVSGSVYLKLENSGKIKEKIVEINLSVPGHNIVSKSEAMKFEIAVDECVSSLERQLKKYKSKSA